MIRCWTEQETAELVRDFAELGAEAIALRIGRTTRAVVAKAHTLGMATMVHWSAEDEAELVRDYAALGPTAIAARIGRTPHAVRAKAQILGVRTRTPHTAAIDRPGRWVPSEQEIQQAASLLRGERGSGWKETQ
jgi:hypothetical protein